MDRMRKLLLSTLLLTTFITFQTYAQCVPATPLPHTEDFETNTSSCGSSCTSACTLAGSWQNASGDDKDWAAKSGSTGSSGTGPSSAHGGSYYIYTEASSCFNKTALLESPCYDFSGTYNPEIEFWYHMLGDDMGTLHLDYRLTPGGPWILDIMSPITDNNSSWQKKNIFLSQLGNEPFVQLRFRGITGPQYESDMSLDDITVKANAGVTDNLATVGFVGFDASADPCLLGSAETFTGRFRSSGSNPIPAGTSIPVTLTVNGQVFNETLVTPSVLNAGDIVDYTFTNTVNMGPGGMYYFELEADYAADQLPGDNVFSMSYEKNAISQFPHITDFENQNNCSASCTTPCLITGFWKNSSNDGGPDWVVDRGGTGTGSTGPSVDHTQGNSDGAYIYLENSSATNCLGLPVYLESGCIDLSNAAKPQIEFWYHMYGNTMGTLELQISTDNRASWSTIGTPLTSNIDLWQSQTHDLTPYKGSTVFLRFVGTMGYTNSDMALDDIFLYDPGTTDIAITAINNPTSGCGLGNAENVEITFENAGPDFMPAGETINFSYNFNGTLVTETYTVGGLGLFVGIPQVFTFNSTVDLAASTFSELSVYADYNGDGNALNDTISTQVINYSVSNYPYVETFDQVDDCYTTGCSNSTSCDYNSIWRNVDDGNVSDTANWYARSDDTPTTNTGPSNDHTGGGKYLYLEASSPCYNARAILESPCLDFSSNGSPILSFWYHMDGSSMGTMSVEASKDGGVTWTEYQAPFSDDEDAWKQKVVLLPGLGGEPSVNIRIIGTLGSSIWSDMGIDDIEIGNLGEEDLSLERFQSPMTSCGLDSAERVIIDIRHNGTLDIPAGTNIPVSYTMNGNQFNETVVLTTDFQAGTVYTHEFSTTVNLATLGSYSFEAEVNHANDSYQANNKYTETIESLPFGTIPSTLDFEALSTCSAACGASCSFTASWMNTNDDDVDWAVDKGGTSSTDTGPDADHTTGSSSGNYVYLEATSCFNKNFAAHLESQCLDFRNVTQPKVIFWYHMYGQTMGTMHFDIDTGRGWELDYVPAWTDNVNKWQEKIIDLGPLAGKRGVRLRIRGIIGTDFYSDMALDDISIVDAGADNLAIQEVLSPNTGCGNSASMPVSIRVLQEGKTPIPAGDTVVFKYTYYGSVVVDTLILTSNFDPGTTLDFTFSQTINAENYGSYDIGIEVIYAGDGFPTDNQVLHNFIGEKIGVLPHLVTFGNQTNCSATCSAECETNEAWRNLKNGVEDELDWLLYSGDDFPSTTGPSGDHTTGSSSYIFMGVSSTASCSLKTAELVSGCYDFTNAENPKISYWHHQFGNNPGVLELQIQINGGAWQTIDGPIVDNQDLWQNRIVDLSNYVGESDVKFKFRGTGSVGTLSDIALDDIEVSDYGFFDLSAALVNPPSESCGLPSDQEVQISISHNGTQSLPAGTVIPVSLHYDFQVYNESLTLSNTFLPGTSISYTFNQELDLSGFGEHEYSASVNFKPQDFYHANDTAYHTVKNNLLANARLFEDFDDENTCSVYSCTSDCPLENSYWYQEPNDSSEWRVDANGTPTSGTGPSEDHTTGDGNYLYLEATTTCYKKQGSIISTCLDFTNSINPELKFWYHMYGTDQGSLHVDVSTNDGITWQEDFVPSWTDNKDQWQEKVIDLSPLKTEGSNIRLRIRGRVGKSLRSDIAIDDILIEDKGNDDVVAERIEYPAGAGCSFTDNELIAFTFRNDGQQIPAGTQLTAYYILNGSKVSETFNLSRAMNLGDTLVYTFTTPADLSNEGIISIYAGIEHTPDINTGNNETPEVSFLLDIVNSNDLPYRIDFEDQSTCATGCASTCSIDNGWFNREDDGRDWLVDKGGTSSSSTGPSADHTLGNANGNYIYLEGTGCYGTTAILESPCIDLSSINNPALSFWYHMYGSTMGYLHVDVKVDNGPWQQNFITPISENINAWQQRVINLAGLAPSTVKIRLRGTTGSNYYTDMAIDDISIIEIDDYDIVMRRVLYPLGGCNVDEYTYVNVELENQGAKPITAGTQIPFTMEFDGQVINEVYTVPSDIPPAATFTYVFQSPIYIPTVGAYNFTASVNFPLEDNNYNDSIYHEFENEKVNQYPFITDFDNEIGCGNTCGTNCDLSSFWRNVYNDENDWLSNSGPTPTAGTGPSFDNTTGNGSYVYFEANSCTNENAFLSSPCLNFSDAEEPSIQFYYHMYGSNMGTMHLDVKYGGGFWIEDFIPSWTDNTNAWKMKKVSLANLAGFGNVRIRFRATGGSGSLSDMAIDDIVVYDCKTPEIVSKAVNFTICESDDIILKVEPKGGLDFRWFKDNVLVATGVDSLVLNSGNVGEYEVEVDYPYGCTKRSEPIQLQVDEYPEKPSLSEMGTIKFCEDEEVTIQVIENYDHYQWYRNDLALDDDTLQSITIEMEGEYKVEVWTNPACTMFSDSIIIEHHPKAIKPTIQNSSTNNAICRDDSINLTLSHTYASYQWFKDDVFVPGANNANYMVSDPGEYFALVTNSNGCDTVSDTIQIDIVFEDPSTIVAQGPTTFCDGGKVRLHANKSVLINWYKNNSKILGVTTQDFVARESGDYYAILYDNGCADTTNTISVTVHPSPAKPIINPQDTSTCDGTNVNLLASGSGQFKWFLDGNLIAGANSNSVVASSTGAYVVEVTSANGCTNRDTAFFTKFGTNSIKVTPIDTTVCSGSAVQLCSNIPTGNQWYFNGNPITGANNQCVWVSQPGNYYTVVTQAQCQGTSDTANVNQQFGQAKPVISYDGSNTFCPNESVLLTSTNAVKYQWMLNDSILPGATNKTYLATEEGLYYIIATNQFGCSDTSAFEILYHYNGPDLYSANVVGNTCPGFSDGSIELLHRGGDQPLQFSIDAGANWQSSPRFNNLLGGTYTAVVTDGNSCTDTLEVVVPEGQTTLSINTVSFDVTCFNAQDGKIFAQADGGQPNYSYTLDGVNYQEDGIFENLIPGSYTVTAQDNLGCEASSDTIFITQPDPIQPSLVIDEAISCKGNGDGVLQASAIGGSGNYLYSIDNGNSWQSSQIFTNIEPGNYILTVQDDATCTAESDILVVDEPDSLLLPIATVVQNVNCYGESTGLITAVAEGGTPPYEYSIDGVNFNPSGTIAGLPAGEYVVTVRDDNDCTFNSDTLEITQGDELFVTASVEQHVDCYGYETGVLKVTGFGGTGPLKFAVDLVNYQSDSMFYDLPAGTYDNITIRDSLGCVVFANPITINQPAIYEITADLVQDISCNGNQDGKIELSITGGAGANLISLDSGLTYSSDTIYHGLAAGTYYVIAQDAQGCEVSIPDPIVIEEPDVLVLDSLALNHVNCNGGTDGFIEVYTLGGTEPISFSVDSGLTYTNNPIVAGLSAGTYPLWIKDASGCTVDAGTFTLLEPNAIVASVQQVQGVSCNGQSDAIIEVNATGGNGGFLYSIDGGQNYQGSNQFTGLAAGTYTVIVNDNIGCQTTETIQIIEPLALQVSNIQILNVSCKGGSDARITITGTGGTGQKQFSIDGGTNYQTNGVFNGLSAGTYQVVIQDAAGCLSNVSNISIIEPDSLLGSIALVQQITCANNPDGSIIAQISGGTAPYTYSLNGAPAVTDSVFDNLGAGTYAINVVDAHGCVFVTDSISLTAPAPIQATAQVLQHQTCYNGNDGALQATASGGAGGFTYSIDGQNYGPSSLFTNLPAGTYTVYVMDNAGCIIQTNQVEILNANAMNITATIIQGISCHGESDGQINVNAAGGAPGPKLFNINGGTWQSNGAFVGLSAGTYIVGVQDAKLCESYDTLELTEPNILEIVVDIISAPNGTDDGYIRLSVLGGTMPYNYVWSNGETTQDIFNLEAGTYTITVTDDKGCKTDSTFHLYNVGVEASPELKVQLYPNPAVDELNLSFEAWKGKLVLEIYDELGNIVYQDAQSNISQDVQQIDISQLAAGTYQIVLSNDNAVIRKSFIVGK